MLQLTLHSLHPDNFEGTVNFNDRGVSKHLLQKFKEIWDKATPDPNFRKLSL